MVFEWYTQPRYAVDSMHRLIEELKDPAQTPAPGTDPGNTDPVRDLVDKLPTAETPTSEAAAPAAQPISSEQELSTMSLMVDCLSGQLVLADCWEGDDVQCDLFANDEGDLTLLQQAPAGTPTYSPTADMVAKEVNKAFARAAASALAKVHAHPELKDVGLTVLLTPKGLQLALFRPNPKKAGSVSPHKVVVRQQPTWMQKWRAKRQAKKDKRLLIAQLKDCLLAKVARDRAKAPARKTAATVKAKTKSASR